MRKSYFDLLKDAAIAGSGGGGGTPPVLIEKPVTENGTYTASDDSADGYSAVTVDVDNSYTAQDEGKVVLNGELVSQTSSSVTENGIVNTTLINSLSVNVSGGTANSVTREVDFVNNTTAIISGTISSVSTYGNMKRCNVADDGTITAFYGDRSYTEDGTNGQVMVRVPKFYYKVDVSENGDLDGVNIRHGKWSISDAPLQGFKLHPAFIADDGVTEIDYFLYGAFTSVGEDSNGVYNTSYKTTEYKLASVGCGLYESTGEMTRATARVMAKNRGNGWYQVGAKQTMAIQMLFAVEYGFNSQLTVGEGIVNDPSKHKAGETHGNGTSGTKYNKVTPVNYRGIENLWGNAFTMIDGINIDTSLYPCICRTYSFVDDTLSGHDKLAFTLPSDAQLYVTAFGYDTNNDWVLLPSEASTVQDANGPIGDNVGTRSGYWSIACIGGANGYQSIAGLFYWRCNTASNSKQEYYSARIMYIP